MNLRSALLIVAVSFSAASQAEEFTPDLFDCSAIPNGKTAIELPKLPERITFTEKDKQEDGTSIGLPPYYIEVPKGYTAVKITEVSRKSHLQEDIGKMLDAAGRAAQGLHAAPQCFLLTPKLKRSTITIEYTIDGKNAQSKKIIAGPAEHVFISADMPVTNIKQLKYDSASNSVIEKEAPSKFYVGINYRIADLAAEDPPFFDTGRISFKFMAQASSNPSASLGAGIGYDLGPMDVFVAYMRTKDDESAYSTDPGATWSPVFGVSFNIDKGIKWLKD